MRRLLGKGFVCRRPKLLFSRSHVFTALGTKRAAGGRVCFNASSGHEVDNFIASSSQELIPKFSHFSKAAIHVPCKMSTRKVGPKRDFRN